MIDTAIIEKILDMSRIEIVDEQKEKFMNQIQDIIGCIEKISTLDTSSVDNELSDFEIANVYDEDIIKDGLTPPQLRKHTTNYLDGYYAVPKITGKGETT